LRQPWKVDNVAVPPGPRESFLSQSQSNKVWRVHHAK
jgi:hypothetical protein